MPSLPPSPARRQPPPLPSPSYHHTGAASLSPSAAAAQDNRYRLPSVHSAFDQVRERTLSSTSISTVGAAQLPRPRTAEKSSRPSSRGIGSKDVRQADLATARPRSARPAAVAHSGAAATSLSPAPTLAALYLVAGLPKDPVCSFRFRVSDLALNSD
jgi:hypothetical protein